MRRDPRDVVAAKRDGRKLPEEDMREFVLAYGRGEIDDALAAAFLMASFINGLDTDETVAMTRAMVESGETLPLEGVSRPKVDKHSTGGVADSVTLIFAPLAASLGLAVAKLSGRGLGHTGGTLDKLESIPGLRTDLSPREMERQVEEVGCAVAAQTKDLVPADGAFYALRDATATVPSTPLIAASIMSKKLAVGTDLILLDVKTGSGAQMKRLTEARDVASACSALAEEWGRRARVAVTDMSQPLGDAVGNALDIAEAIRALRGEEEGRLMELVVEFASAALVSLQDVPEDEGRDRARTALRDGSALEAFRRMVEAQGGDPRVVDDPETVLPGAPVIEPLMSTREGWLGEVDAEEVGKASVMLGAGRLKKGDPIDPAVGVVFRTKIGDRVERGEPMGEVHARDEEAAAEAADRVRAALTFSEDEVEAPPLLYGWHGA
ncbi:MAG TPA: thymidine phosphorylase [Actinomycetota bacterium]